MKRGYMTEERVALYCFEFLLIKATAPSEKMLNKYFSDTDRTIFLPS